MERGVIAVYHCMTRHGNGEISFRDREKEGAAEDCSGGFADLFRRRRFLLML